MTPSKAPRRAGIINRWFILRLAWRNLRAHRLRTTLTLTGVSIGIAAIVFLLAFAYGIENVVTKELSSGNALLLLDVSTGNSQIVKIDDDVVNEIKAIPHVSHVYLLTGVAAKYQQSGESTDLGFFGTNENFLSLSGVNIKYGRYFEASSKPELVINTAFAKILGYSDYQKALDQTVKVDVVVPKELADSLDDVTVPDVSYTITGVFQDDSSPKAYTSYLNLEKLGLKNFTQIKVEADTTDAISRMRQQIESLGLQTQYVGDTVNQINQVFTIFKAVLAAFGSVTLIVSLLGMFNTLTISLLERMKEIALLKILGARRRDISMIFLTESVMLGTMGGALGIIVGLIGGKIVNTILNLYAASSGSPPVALFYYPVTFMVVIMLLATLIGLGTGWYPARRAMKIKPLDVLRYE